MNILVTGGAGFIGSFLVDRLVELGHKVRIYDNLEPQVHQGKIPPYLNKEAQFIKADICDEESLDKALESIDVVFHEAAMVGVGQSMYQVVKYTRVNELGTATLLDLIVNKHRHHIRKLIVAASMSEYGEGLYHCPDCQKNIKPPLRDEKDLGNKIWNPKCLDCRSFLTPVPTNEEVPLLGNSIYAINKRVQEDMVTTIGKAFKIPTVALRYFNVYGPRQSLSNPYTGVAAIFISRIKANHPPVVYEDGRQSRDFISIHDIVEANIEAMTNKNADYKIFNVGSGTPMAITDLARLLLKLFGKKMEPDITYKFRRGDIRHCFADISKIKKVLGWQPKVTMDRGMKELIEWGQRQEAKDLFNEANKILREKGVI